MTESDAHRADRDRPSSGDIAYLVHDLADPAVHRRIRMWQSGDATVDLLGFRRVAHPIADVLGIAPADFGQTRNASFLRRIASVALAALRIGRWRRRFAGASVLVARNLEMLALAAWARRRFGLRVPLVYECLDVHRLMVSDGMAGRALRALERRLLAQSAALIVSSPAFVSAHFDVRYGPPACVMLVENKVLGSELGEGFDPMDGTHPMARPPAPPWRIGWFGVLRCRRSLQLLADLVGRHQGRVEVILRGRPALDEIPDFHEIVAATPGLSFHGAYDRAVDLPRIYGEVHFAWAMDFYEAGANSNWLLPNRLYEGGLYNAVLIADASVETGRWLARHEAGIRLAEPLPEALDRFIDALTPDSYAGMAARSAAIPIRDLVAERAECLALVRDLKALAP